MSVIGSDLASLLGDSVLTTKTIDPCISHQLPKEFFHQQSKTTGCHKCFLALQTPADQLVDAREYCSTLMERYISILDNATYMPCEHIQKEKEYGIPWRSAFKKELTEIVFGLGQRTLGEHFDDNKDSFVLLHQIVKKDVIDAATFDTRTQAEYLCLMVDQLELLEKCVYTIKCLLKQPDFHEFEATKEKKLAELRDWQTKQNKERPNTKHLEHK